MSEQNNYQQNQNTNTVSEKTSVTENNPYAPVNTPDANSNTGIYTQPNSGQYSVQYQAPQQPYTQPSNDNYQNAKPYQPAQGQYTQQQYSQNQQYNQYPQYNTSQYNPAANSEEKTRKTCAIVGFVMAMVMILALVFGMTMGAIFVIIAVCLCVYGLKSSKRGLAIAGIVISAIEAVVWVLAIIGAIMP